MFAHLKISLYVSLFCILGACGNGSSAYTSDSINEALEEAGSDESQGPVGSESPAEAIGISNTPISWQGNWSSETTYSVYDVVAFNGHAYIAVQNTTGLDDPTDTAYWNLFAEKGADGPAGPQGPAGVHGADGTQGIQGPAGLTGADGPQGFQGPAGPIGATGPQGTTGAAGTSFNWQGTWVSRTIYVSNDVVDFNGRSYIALQNTTGTEDPSDRSYWDLFADKGADGETGPQGLTGLSGPQGVAGPVGPQGSVGVNGADGPQGIAGPVGLTGADGLQGLQGLVGVTGDQGPQGSQGLVGITGAEGPQGTQGLVGITGADGSQGIQGLAGLTGATGSPGVTGAAGTSFSWQGNWLYSASYATNDVVAFSGRSYIAIQNPSSLQDPTDSNYWELLADKGADGAAGPQGTIGAAGPQGMTGPDGPQGPAGVDGDDGSQGIQGLIGLTGDQGPQGIQGPLGPDGATGPQGDPGATGPQGPVGSTGLQGETGAAGTSFNWLGVWSDRTVYATYDVVAFNGRSYIATQIPVGLQDPTDPAYWDLLADKGADGAIGSQGPIGLTGPQGVAGSIGPQGPAGADGGEGPQGIAGTVGLTGAEGSQGIQGLVGLTGTEGPQGIQGPTGLAGATGPQGAAGTSFNWQGSWLNVVLYATNDAVAFNGRSYIAIQIPSSLQDPTNPDYWELLADKGADGAAGPQGTIGATGPQGVAGTIGPQGPAGADGGEGSQGTQGLVGLTGAEGPQGTQGLVGLTGGDGTQGIQGLAGPTGATGPQGAQGATGLQGPAGIDWQGSWQSGTSYLVYDAVAYNGSSYIAIQDTSGSELPTDQTYWELVAEKASTTNNAYQVAGFTNTTVPGTGGYLALANACETEFGSSARVATSQEVLDTPALATGTGQAWVRGISASGGFVNGWIMEMASGIWAQSINCQGWRDIGTTGSLALDTSNHSFTTASCNSSNKVACAIPATTVYTYGYVGFSTATVVPGGGYHSINGACQSDYGVNARIATSREVLDASGLVVQTGYGWVEGIRDPSGGTNDQTTGLEPNANSCHGWSSSSSSSYSLVIDGTDMHFGSYACSGQIHVACSAPQ